VLLETFHHYLGPRFTPDMQEAWEQAYEMISTQMLEGADMLPPQEGELR
jgi:methyl-accepting chemotaxis protein